MQAYPWTTLSTLACLLAFFVLSLNVGRARSAFGVHAPATAGHPEFEKRYRVQMNTLEQLVFFLPLLWLGAAVLGDRVAAVSGVVWVAGRILYARSYYRDPATRTLGFALTVLPAFAMLVGVLVGTLSDLL